MFLEDYGLVLTSPDSEDKILIHSLDEIPIYDLEGDVKFVNLNNEPIFRVVHPEVGQIIIEPLDIVGSATLKTVRFQTTEQDKIIDRLRQVLRLYLHFAEVAHGNK